jgi:hypothetical protein
LVKLNVLAPDDGEPDSTKTGVPVKEICAVDDVQLTTVVELAVVVMVPLVPKAIVLAVAPLAENVVQVQL